MIKNINPRIAIIGAGPSGLLTAYYLQERGYTNVIVLEKLGRVGGRCRSMTVDNHSFDLGANYITPAYKEIRKLARKVKATMYAEGQFTAMSVPDDPAACVKYESIFKATRFDDRTQREIGLLKFLWALMRFTWIRWRLSSFIDKPTFEGVESYDEGSLCCTLEQWLENNNLTELRRVLQLPSVMMGYGYLNEIAAIYILKFMTLRTFISMLIKELPVIGRYYGWPKRFTYGYQRFFEKIAWNLNVRFNVDIKHIHRTDDLVTIEYLKLEQDLDDTATPEGTLEFDYLILACPLNIEVTGELLDLNECEYNQLKPIKVNSYCMSTFSAKFNGGTLGNGAPLAAVYPMPPLDDHFIPYAVAAQWQDCEMVQIYTRTKDTSQDNPDQGDKPDVETPVMNAAAQVLKQMGADITPLKKAMRTFNRWAYFQHVCPEIIANDKWYTNLEKLQGQNRTYYVGGVTNFDLIEPIAEYSKHQVAKHFPRIEKSID